MRGWTATALFASLLAGCGGQGPSHLPLHPASGTVLVDGRPAAGVQVRFHPAEPGPAADLTPFALTGDDGRFSLGTYRKDDGAPEGRYKVTLFWPDRPPGPHSPVDQLGGAYADPSRSGLAAEVSRGRPTVPTFEVKKAARPQTPPTPRKARNAGVDGLE